MTEYLLFGAIGAMFVAYLLVIIDVARIRSRINRLEGDKEKIADILGIQDQRIDLTNDRLDRIIKMAKEAIQKKEEARNGSDES